MILEERSDVWINLFDMLYCLPLHWSPLSKVTTAAESTDFYFLWASERTGYAQLYLYQYDSISRAGICLSGPIGGGGDFVVER